MAEHYYTPKLKNGFMGSGQKQFNWMSICDPDIIVQNASTYKNGVFSIAKYVLIWSHPYISTAYEIVEK